VGVVYAVDDSMAEHVASFQPIMYTYFSLWHDNKNVGTNNCQLVMLYLRNSTKQFTCNNFLPDTFHCVAERILKSIKVWIILRWRYNYFQQPSIQSMRKT